MNSQQWLWLQNSIQMLVPILPAQLRPVGKNIPSQLPCLGSHFGPWPHSSSSQPGIRRQSILLSPRTTGAFKSLDYPHTSHNKVSKVLKTKTFYPALLPNKKASLSPYKLAYWRTLPGTAEELHSISVCFINRGSFPTISNVKTKVKESGTPNYMYIYGTW